MAFAAVNPLETTMVLTNQVGYDLRDAKTFLVQSPKDMPAPRFVVKDKSDGRTVLKGDLQPLGTMKSWGGGWAAVRYWKGDFSRLEKPGRYVIEVGDSDPVASPSFAVGDRVVLRDLALFSGSGFLKTVRFGKGGWQSDGVPAEDNVLFCVGAGTYGLAKAYDADTAYWKQQGKSDAMIEEIRWGMKGLMFAQEQEKNGRFVGTNPDGRNDAYAGLGIAALARLARASYLTREERDDCLKRAKQSWEYYKDKDKLIEAFEGRLHYAPLAHGLMVLASTELYEVDKDQRYLQSAADQATAAARLWNRWWPHAGGWTTEQWQAGIMPGCLANFAIKHPKSVPDGVKNALRRWTEYANPLSENVFGMPAWDRSHFLNPLVNGPGAQWGENGRYITNAWALSLAARWSGKAKLRTMALNNLNYVMGVNPAGVCMIHQKGERSQEGWWGLVRAGSISNGMITISAAQGQPVETRPYTGATADRKEKNGAPAFVGGNQFPNIYCTSEPWSPYNGWMLIALSEMVDAE